MEQKTIHFTKEDNNTDEITTWECVRLTAHFFKLSVKRVYNIIDNFVHTNSWCVLFLTIVLSIAISCIYIGNARAERDRTCKLQYKLEQQLKALQCRMEVTK